LLGVSEPWHGAAHSVWAHLRIVTATLYTRAYDSAMSTTRR
jgi:hypothetical protein